MKCKCILRDNCKCSSACNFKSGTFPTHLLPACRNACIIHAVQSVPQALAHDDRSINCQPEVGQGVTDQDYDPLHPINLLTQEDVHRLEGTHLLETLPHLVSLSQMR